MCLLVGALRSAVGNRLKIPKEAGGGAGYYTFPRLAYGMCGKMLEVSRYNHGFARHVTSYMYS